MYCIVPQKDPSDETAPSFRETNNSAHTLRTSHDFQIRRQCINRLKSSFLDNILRGVRSGKDASEIWQSLGFDIDTMDAAETPLTWAHVIYLSIDE